MRSRAGRHVGREDVGEQPRPRQTPEVDKELAILENSAHGAMGDDVDLFLDSIRDFIEAYRR